MFLIFTEHTSQHGVKKMSQEEVLEKIHWALQKIAT